MNFLKENIIYVLIVLGVILLAFIIACMVIRKYKKAIALLYSICDDNVESDIVNFVENSKQRKQELLKIQKEYNDAIKQVNKRFEKDLRKIDKKYSKEADALSKELKHNLKKAKGNKEFTVVSKENYDLKLDNLTKNKLEEEAPIRKELNESLEAVNKEYEPYLKELQTAKRVVKDSTFLKKAIAYAKKHEYVVDSIEKPVNSDK